MGQIFIAAGQNSASAEAREMIQLRDLVVPELRSRGFSVLSVPDDLSMGQAIAWINARARTGDIALALTAGRAPDPMVRGASVFHIANNETRKSHAELLLLALLRRLPQLPSRGARPDTATATGSLSFCRQVASASLLMEVGFLSNPDDRNLLQNRRRDVALGIADGLAAWSRAVGGDGAIPEQPGTLPEINISLNGGTYGEKGVIINDNSYVPIDLVDQIGVDLSRAANVRRVRYRNIVYIKAVDLRDFNISVGWEAASRTVLIRSRAALGICPGLIDQIMGHGNTSEVQLFVFLKNNHDSAGRNYGDLPKIYREEGAIEGVNYDIAFAQMCVETNFLRFGSDLTPDQNNFGGIGAVGGSSSGAVFLNRRIGVRAHIQHLKAYGSTEPLVQEQVDPRFNFVSRGIAPLVGQLSGRWAADLDYGDRILAVLRRLYESAGLL